LRKIGGILLAAGLGILIGCGGFIGSSVMVISGDAEMVAHGTAVKVV
jgi:hypothetical protein